MCTLRQSLNGLQLLLCFLIFCFLSGIRQPL
jgi:hypothetical protein